MKKIFSLLMVLALLVSCQDKTDDYSANIASVNSPKGTSVFAPDSASIADNYVIPEWFRDAKFGVFIHWGVYSVPAFGNEWYPRQMYQKDSRTYKHHIETYGSQDTFGYKDFIPLFKAEYFNADQWIDLFKRSGIKYVVPVAEHHDGFSMYHSRFNPWNAYEMGPERDILGELKMACETYGLHFGLSSHRAENAWFYNGGMEFPSDVQDPDYRSLYGQCLASPGSQSVDCPEGAGFNEESKANWLRHTYELIDFYQPELFWFDWTVGKIPFQETFYQFMAYYYNNAIDWDKGVVVNTKFGFGNNIQVFDIERGKSAEIRKYPWQTDTSIGKRSWGYIDNEVNKTPNQIIDDLIDIVSKNGNLLLNIGPRPDGTITEEQSDILLEIGDWLTINGEAIYGTRPWIVSGEGDVAGTAGKFTDNEESKYTAQDIRFTKKDDVIYAICLDWADEGVLIKSISQEIPVKKVRMLGAEEDLAWEWTSEGLKVKFPEKKPFDYAFSLKIIQ